MDDEMDEYDAAEAEAIFRKYLMAAKEVIHAAGMRQILTEIDEQDSPMALVAAAACMLCTITRNDDNPEQRREDGVRILQKFLGNMVNAVAEKVIIAQKAKAKTQEVN